MENKKNKKKSKPVSKKQTSITAKPKLNDLEIKQVSQDFILKKKSIFSKIYWKQLFTKKDFKRVIIVNMQHANGSHRTFYVKTNDDRIEINNKIYLIDEEALYFNVTFKEYCLDFHENLALPLTREAPLNDIYENLEGLQEDLAITSNPSLLKKFIKSEIIQEILKGESIDKYFRQLRLLVIIILLECTIIFFLVLNMSGLFKGGN